MSKRGLSLPFPGEIIMNGVLQPIHRYCHYCSTYSKTSLYETPGTRTKSLKYPRLDIQCATHAIVHVRVHRSTLI